MVGGLAVIAATGDGIAAISAHESGIFTMFAAAFAVGLSGTVCGSNRSESRTGQRVSHGVDPVCAVA
jgi:hypothetical protein